jgi:hypothetical protein
LAEALCPWEINPWTGGSELWRSFGNDWNPRTSPKTPRKVSWLDEGTNPSQNTSLSSSQKGLFWEEEKEIGLVFYQLLFTSPSFSASFSSWAIFVSLNSSPHKQAYYRRGLRAISLIQSAF